MKDLSLHILDIVQNSLVAGATEVFLCIEQNSEKNILAFSIDDNGRGMSAETLKVVTDPFYTTRTTRKVGMGISLLKQNAEQTGGSLIIESKLGVGTKLASVFKLDHIDRPPMGDIAGVMVLIVGGNSGVRFKYTHIVDGNEYVFDTLEVNEALEGAPINEPSVMRFLKEMLNENLISINAK
jgi:hypothetical protein